MALQQLTTTGWQTVGGSGGVTPDENGWVRPSDWLPLPDIDPTASEVHILVAVWPNSVNAVRPYVGTNDLNGTVDWGDGTSETYTGLNEHTYDYDALPASSLCSRGYKQAIISITLNDVVTFYGGYRTDAVYLSGNTRRQSTPFLDIHIGSPFLTRFNIGQTTSGSSPYALSRMLEHIHFYSMAPTTASNGHNYAFYGCSSLQSITGGENFTPIGNIGYAFKDCKSLVNAPFFDASAVTGMFNTFQNCESMRSVPAPLDTSSVTTFSYCFYQCWSLEAVPSWDTSSATNTSNLITGCYNLRTVGALNFGPSTNGYSISGATGGTNSLTWVDVYGHRYSMDYSYRLLSRAALVNIFTNLGTADGTQTVTVANNPGSADLTADDIAIATAKGWTVVS